MSEILKKKDITQLVESTITETGLSLKEEKSDKKKVVTETKEKVKVVTEEKKVVNEQLDKEINDFKRLINYKY